MAIRAIAESFTSSVRDFVAFQKSGGAGTPTVLRTELKPTVPTVSISATIAGLHGTLGEAVRASGDLGPLRATMFEDFMIEQKKAPAVAQEQEREMDEESENQSFVPVQSAGDHRMDYCRVMTRSNATMALLIAMADETNEFEPRIGEYLGRLAEYTNHWEGDGDAAITEFEAKNPPIREIKEQTAKLSLLETRI
jgi:hypothetical protein